MLALVATLLAQTYVSEQTSFGGDLNYCPGFNASIDAYHGIATGGTIGANGAGKGLVFVPRRRDTVAQMSVHPEVFVDGGVIWGAFVGGCGFSLPPRLAVTPDEVVISQAFHPDCSSNADGMAGGLVISGVAGNFSLRSNPQNQLTIGGQLGLIHDAYLADGGRPSSGDYEEGVVCAEPDGGAYFCWAGDHGSVTSMDTTPMSAGVIHQFDNAEHPRTRHVAGVDHHGAYYQSHSMPLEEFGSPVPLQLTTTKGQFHYFRESRLMYAFDTHHWYFANGEAWVRLAEQPSIDALQLMVLILEARLAVVEARCL